MPANILRDLTWANERQKLHKKQKQKVIWQRKKFPLLSKKLCFVVWVDNPNEIEINRNIIELNNIKGRKRGREEERNREERNREERNRETEHLMG